MAQLSVKVDRYKYIGGSDIAIMMNLSPFKTRWQLLQEKARIVEDDFKGNCYTEYGNTLEPKIRAWLNHQTKSSFLEGKHYLLFEDIPVRIHTDGEDKKKGSVLEVKTTSHIKASLGEYKVYLVQLIFYMKMLNYENGLLAVYDRPDDLSEIFDESRLQTFDVKLSEHEELWSEIEKAIQLFSIDLERLKENPYIKQADLLAEDEAALVRRLISLSEQEGQIKAITAERKDIESKLLEVMAKNGRKAFDGFGYKVTSVSPTEDKVVENLDFDMESFRKEEPEIFAKYCKEIKMVKKKGRDGFIKLTRKDD